MKFKMTLIAGAIAAFAAAPALAQSSGSTGTTKTESGQSTSQRSTDTTSGQSTTGRSTDTMPGQSATGRSTDGTKAPGTPASAQSSDKAPAVGRSADAAPGQMSSDRAAASSAQARNPIYIQSAGHLKGMEVVDLNDKEVGKVDRIVLAPDRKSAHAVISSGGLLGMGARDVLVSLDSLTEVDGKLKMRESKAQVDAMKEYDKSNQYVELTGDTPIQGSIVEFSAFEPDKDAGSPAVAPPTPGAPR